ncbi:hypothetical protein [Pseudomonas sp. 2835]|uniref:hypothetical protein n=1 Tax=Pseudomonas sp. 2835 TaxID=3156451 RepID=UPI003D1C00D3
MDGLNRRHRGGALDDRDLPGDPNLAPHLQATLQIWDEEYEINAQQFRVSSSWDNKVLYLDALNGIQPLFIEIPISRIPQEGDYEFDLTYKGDIEVYLGGTVVPVQHGKLSINVSKSGAFALYEGRFYIRLAVWDATLICSGFRFASRERTFSVLAAPTANERSSNEMTAIRRFGYNELSEQSGSFALEVVVGPNAVHLGFRGMFWVWIEIPESRIPVSGSYVFDLQSHDDVQVWIGTFSRLPYGTVQIEVSRDADLRFLRVEGSFRARNRDLVSSLVCDHFAISTRERQSATA